MKSISYTAIICIILVSVNIPVLIAQYIELQVNENGTEIREIINAQSKRLDDIKVTCLGYNSLADLQIEKPFDYITHVYFISIQFVNCFNNKTDHRNYREFSLMTMFGKLRMNLSSIGFISIKNSEYGIMDSNIFFNDFDFNKYRNPILQNIGFADTDYLQKVQCCHLVQGNANQINFTKFTNNSIATVNLTEMHIINFTKSNLANFPFITRIVFINFQLDDSNALNVPELFRDNIELISIYLERSWNRLILHADVFLGLYQLKYLRLNELKLETLPKNIFRDLIKLIELHLMNNNIKSLDPKILVSNIDLVEIYMGNDEYLYSPEFQYLEVPCEIQLHDINVKDVKMLRPILKSSSIKFLALANCSIWDIDLVDIMRENMQYSGKLVLQIFDIPFRISLSQLENSTNLTWAAKKFDQIQLNLFINILHTMWPNTNCVIDPEFFMWYFDGKLNEHLYLEKYQTIIHFIHDGYLELGYKILFVDNCPVKCKCYHNPLIDNVYIDCSGQNLLSIPIIPYPTQINKIHQIELNLNDNFLDDINFDLQDDRILQKLTLVDFDRNLITGVILTENVAHMNYTKFCVWDDFTFTKQFNDGKAAKPSYLCGISVTNLTYTGKYLRSKSKQEIRDVLDSISRNATCSMNG